jgi:hypothetical protein
MMKNDNFISSVNILDGIIAYNSFDIDDKIPFESQRHSLKEDILQIKFGDRFLLDVGWYPEMDPNGHFVARAIQDYDWKNPLSKIESHSLSELKKAIEEVAALITSKQKIKNLPFRKVEY